MNASVHTVYLTEPYLALFRVSQILASLCSEIKFRDNM